MPVGKREVTDALIEAATTLFAERGPGAVSVRDVAAQAGVNHGLVHRHFGSKEALVTAVLDHLVTELREALAAQASANPEELFDAVAVREDYWRVLARALLDGHTDWLADGSFPVIAKGIEGVEALKQNGDLAPDLDAQAVVATFVAVGLGWLVFEPFIAAATGMGGTPASRRERMTALWRRLATARQG